MYNNKEAKIGFFGGLTIAFIVLKLIEKLEWSWLWVLSPLWLPYLVVFVILMTLYTVGDIIKHFKDGDKK